MTNNEGMERICKLEHTLMKASGQLAVIARGLDGLAQAETMEAMSEADRSAILGAVSLLGLVATECDRVVEGVA